MPRNEPNVDINYNDILTRFKRLFFTVAGKAIYGIMEAAVLYVGDTQVDSDNPVPTDLVSGAKVQITEDGTNVVAVMQQAETGEYELLVTLQGHLCADNSTTDNLVADEVFTGDWQDTLDFASIIVGIKSDQDSATDGLEIQWSDDGVSVIQDDVFSIFADTGKVFTFTPANRYFRVVYTNGATPTTSISIQTILKRVGVKGSSHRINDAIVGEDDAELMKAVITGLTPAGSFKNVQVTNAGNIKTSIEELETQVSVNSNTQLKVTPFSSDGNEGIQFQDENGNPYGIKQISNKPRVSATDYLLDIVKGNVPGHKAINKFGMNDNVGTTEQLVSDLGQTTYPYLTSAEQLQVASSDVDDQGLLVSSGTATGGSATTIVDTGADFVTDGVAVGDLLINDTKSIHGSITAVTATTLTVFRMSNNASNEAGDTYRVANANDTGAAVISLQGLDGNYAQISEDIILNGTTDVTTSKSYLRVFRARVHLAGSSLYNEGAITVTNNAGTSDLAQISAMRGQTLMAQWTVPEGFTLYVVQWSVGDESNKGAEVVFKARPFGEAWQIKDIHHTVGSPLVRPYKLPNKYGSRTDIEIRATSVQAGGAINSDFDGWYEL